MGCSTHRVPSLSNVAMRYSGLTKSRDPSLVTRATKSTIAFFGSVSLHEGNGSCARAAEAPHNATSANPMTLALIHEHRFSTEWTILLSARFALCECGVVESKLTSLYKGLTTTSLVDPMLHTTARRLLGPFPRPYNSFGQSAAERPTDGNVGTLVHGRRRQCLLSRLCKHRRLLFLSLSPVRLGKAGAQRRSAVASAFAACVRETLPL